MKYFLVFLTLISFAISGFSQSFELWNSIGANYKLNDQVFISANFTPRMGDGKVQSFFPEASVKYKLVKWAHVSLDYRLVSKREDNGNYLSANRLNFNLKLRNAFKRLKYSFRFRYQMSSSGNSGASYESDFDEAFRFKPSLSYKIKKSIFEPKFGLDFFYNPTRGVYGQRFDKIRYSLGSSIDLGGAHGLIVSLKLDQKFNSSKNGSKLIFAIGYEADLKKLLKGSRSSSL